LYVVAQADGSTNVDEYDCLLLVPALTQQKELLNNPWTRYPGSAVAERILVVQAILGRSLRSH
jgi:hypothetical protein